MAEFLEGVNHLAEVVAPLLGEREGVDVAAPFQWSSFLLDVAFLSEAFGDLHPVVGQHGEFVVHPAFQLGGVLCGG